MWYAHLKKEKMLNNVLILEIWAFQIEENKLWNQLGGKWHRRNWLICLHLEINSLFF